MPEGPLGGPRPFARSRDIEGLGVAVVIEGPDAESTISMVDDIATQWRRDVAGVPGSSSFTGRSVDMLLDTTDVNKDQLDVLEQTVSRALRDQDAEIEEIIVQIVVEQETESV